MFFATAKDMAKLDRLAVAQGLAIRQMMELAGFHMLEVLRRLKFSPGQLVVIVVGKGNKGGDGLSAARHLLNNGFDVSVVLATKKRKSDPQHLLKLLEKRQGRAGSGAGRSARPGRSLSGRLKIINYPARARQVLAEIKKADIVIDALIGYRLKGAPREPIASLVKEINAAGKKVIAYDVPTGLDATSGACLDPCLKARATLSLALPKKAFSKKSAKKYVGCLFLADLGIPQRLYQAVGPRVRRPDFKQQGVIEL